MYDRILVPTDGSDVAELAVDHALDLAETYGATVHALYVVDVDAVDLGLGTEQVDRIRAGKFGEMDELEARARGATATVADRARDRGLEVVEQITAGRPHTVIAEYADDHDHGGDGEPRPGGRPAGAARQRHRARPAVDAPPGARRGRTARRLRCVPPPPPWS